MPSVPCLFLCTEPGKVHYVVLEPPAPLLLDGSAFPVRNKMGAAAPCPEEANLKSPSSKLALSFSESGEPKSRCIPAIGPTL